MGQRANYVILERGSTLLYYSHWGGGTVPADAFWGPSSAESLIRTNSPADQWLPSPFAEGGIALDKDRRRAFFFGKAELLDSPEMWNLFLSLAGRVWAADGWSLEVGKNQEDMAEFCGKPRSSVRVEAPDVPPAAFPLTKFAGPSVRSHVCAFVAHKTAVGLEDRVVGLTLSGALLNGPAFLSLLAELPTLDEARADAVERRDPRSVFRSLRSFALLDETTMSLEVFDPFEARTLNWIAKAWPGWTVGPLAGGIEGYFRRTGRAVPQDIAPLPLAVEAAPRRSRAECLARIERYVFGQDRTKKQLLKGTHEFRASHDEPGMVFAAGFLKEVPESPLAERDRREIWTKLVESE
jgi:hypothetical protein